MSSSTHRWLSSFALLCLCFGLLREVPAQDGDRPFTYPGGFDPSRFGDPSTFTDPDKFFGQFFGHDPEAADSELDKIEISFKEESQIGAKELEAFKQRLAAKRIKLKDRGPEVTYLKKLLSALGPLMKQQSRYRDIDVYYYEINDPQAYTLPGGTVLVSRGMLKAARCEAALVCVLGHELAHLDRGHLLRRARQMKLLSQRGSPADGQKMMGTMMSMFMKPFHPSDELEADTDGITWAYELGYDPRSVEDMYAAVEKGALPGGRFMPIFLQTHPPSEERRQNLADRIAQLERDNPKRDLYLGVENLRRRIPKSERRFAE